MPLGPGGGSVAAVNDPASAVCERLEWDSRHFGLAIARFRGDAMDEAAAAAADGWCREREIDCLYLLADAEDAETARVAARHGHRVVDVRLDMRHDLEGLPDRPWHSAGAIAVRRAEPADLEALAPIAARAHLSTRFYFDGGFPRERCDALYVSWLERALADPSRELLAAERDGKAIGYHALGLPDSGQGRADLIGLDPAHRGRGLGEALLTSSLLLLRELGAGSVATSMQARNASPVRGHERVGFRIESTRIWHHRWYRSADGG